MKSRSRTRLISCTLALLFLVLSCYPVVLAEESAEAPSATISLFLLMNLEKNSIFAKYNVEVDLDGEHLCVIEQGGQYQNTLQVVPGVHILTFSEENKHGLKARTQFRADADTAYSCTLQARTLFVDIKSEQLNQKEYSVDALSIEDYKALCLVLPPSDDFLMNSDAYNGIHTCITGKVHSASDSSVFLEDENGIFWFGYIDPPLTNTVIHPGDVVSLYGSFSGGNMKYIRCRCVEFVSAANNSQDSSASFLIAD